MAAPTEIYVDPSIDGNSGAGTVGDPYGDLAYALTSMTYDSTNGNRINIKEGDDEVLTATLTLGFTPDDEAPLIFQGYESTAGDGGIGGISGDGTYGIMTGNQSSVSFIDLHLHNCGSATILEIGNYTLVQNCEVDNTSGNGIEVNNRGLVIGCHVHNIGDAGIYLINQTGIAMWNYLKNDGANDFNDAIEMGNSGTEAHYNIISIDGASNGIRIGGLRTRVFHNSIYSPSGTGSGIYLSATNRNEGLYVAGNVIAGFDGSGGELFDFLSSGTKQIGFADNAADGTYTEPEAHYLSNNEASLSTPFALSGSDTFANRLTYFEPADVGNVLNGARNNSDKGAVQQAAGGGGASGGSITRSMSL